MIRLIPIVILMTFVALTIGCSASDHGTVIPPVDATTVDRTPNVHQLWGLWQFTADPAAHTLDIIPARSADFHLNALPFLEPPALVNLTLESLKFNGNIIEADIGLRHPFLGLTEFTGFDVCGIFITNGSVTGFSDADLRMAGAGDTRLLNPDGYTRWWNPAEFPINTGTMFAYTDGLLGAKDSVANFNSTLNAYKYFCDDLGPNDAINKIALGKRGMFSPGQKNVRHYTIDMGAGLVFNYAVDACWQFPGGPKPWTAPDDFGENANRPEAYRIVVTETANTLYNDGTVFGGDLSLSIDVYDWFNAEKNTVKVESPGNFPIQTSSTPAGGGAGYSTYEIDIADATPSPGNINLLIHIASEGVGYGGLLPGKNVTVYFTRTVAVSSEPPIQQSGWARNWGPSAYTGGKGLAVDNKGNAFVTGKFQGTIDFDPGTPVDNHTSFGGYDVYVSKFDNTGAFQWARTWGGTDWEYNRGVAVDSSGNVYVPGYYAGVVDFDPDPVGEDNHTSNGAQDAFVSKFDPDGNFLWARTWGGSSSEDAYGAETNAFGNVYVTGQFQGTVDFDPDPIDKENHSSNGVQDVYLVKFDSTGDFIWARTWGGSAWDYGHDVAVDSSGNVYCVGWFAGTVDFDPGTGGDNHTPDVDPGVYLSKFDSSGNFIWARTWGGSSYQNYDFGIGVNVDNYSNIYIAGRYTGMVDFDPSTGGTDNHTSEGDVDAFLSSFDSAGVFRWARTWGSTSGDYARGVAADSSGNVCVGGHYSGTVDFNPDPVLIDNHTSQLLDVYLSKFDSSGNFLWARTWGASGNDRTGMVGMDKFGDAFFTGILQGTANLAPASPPCDELPDYHSSSGECDAFLIKVMPDGCW